jgi:AraC-like DNA-binding protein
MEGVSFLHELAKSVGAPVTDGRIILPVHLGVGWLTGIEVNKHLKMIIRNYELKVTWQKKQIVNKHDERIISIAFHHVFKSPQDLTQSSFKNLLPLVQITTIGFDDIFVVRPDGPMRSIIILVHAEYLEKLLGKQSDSAFINTIISGNLPFLFEELISPRIQDIADEIIKARPPQPLWQLFYSAKAEELIYLFLLELLKRNENTIGSINVSDIKTIYQIRDAIINSTGALPAIGELANNLGMSESKLQYIFKQVFGTTIYKYFQTVRMREAARLIKDEGLTVSEAGYRSGFSNLSHFSRLFEIHIGVKPKKYALSFNQ